MAYIPDRGDFARIVLEPQVGREQSGERPALVLSGRPFNEITGYAFVAPVADTRSDWPFEVPIPPGGGSSGVVLTDQKSIDHKARHVRHLAAAPPGLADAALERVAAILEV